MKPKTEEKILKDYLKLIESPDANEKKYRWFARTLFTVGMLFIFYYLSDNVENGQPKNIIIVAAFISGLCFGLGIWFSQMGSQTKLFIKHLSKSSINERINEINT